MTEEGWLSLFALGVILAHGGLMALGFVLGVGAVAWGAATIAAALLLLAVVNGWKGKISSWWWRFRHQEEQNPFGFC